MDERDNNFDDWGKVSSSDLFARRLVCRGQNVSILHLRSTSDPWEVGSQGSSYSVGSNKSQGGGKGKSSGNARGSYTRGTSIPSLKRHDTTASASTSSLKQHRQDCHSQASKESKKKIFYYCITLLWNLVQHGISSELSLRRMKNFTLETYQIFIEILKIHSYVYSNNRERFGVNFVQPFEQAYFS